MTDTKDGVNPKGFDVHHIIALSQGGTNAPSNLILLRSSPEHLKVTAQQNSAMAGMNYGDSRTLDTLYPPQGIVIYRGP